MGKTSKPLFLVIEKDIENEVFDKLRAQGHTVAVVKPPLDGHGYPDGFLGPRCWRLDKDVASDESLMETVLKQLRKVKQDGVDNTKAASGKDTPKPTRSRRTKAGRDASTPEAPANGD